VFIRNFSGTEIQDRGVWNGGGALGTRKKSFHHRGEGCTRTRSREIKLHSNTSVKKGGEESEKMEKGTKKHATPRKYWAGCNQPMKKKVEGQKICLGKNN